MASSRVIIFHQSCYMGKSIQGKHLSHSIAYSYGCWKGHSRLLNWFREESKDHIFLGYIFYHRQGINEAIQL